MDWKPLLRRQNARRTRGNGMQGLPKAAFDLGNYWLGRSYEQTRAQAPLPVARAQALRQVLQAVPKTVRADALFAGEPDWFADELPAGIGSPEAVGATVAASAQARRHFWAGYDHTIPAYPELLKMGVAGLRTRLETARERQTAPEKRLCLDALAICLEALAEFIADHARAARQAGRDDLAPLLERLATAPPQTLHEAMQLIWLVHLALASEGRGHNALGRLDQWLLPFYERDLAAGRLDRAGALNLFCHLWSMIEGLHEITNICIGGVRADGSDATNELTYLCLEATRAVRSPATNLSARFHAGSPERYHRACAEVILSGIGFPAIFNDTPNIAMLIRHGIPLEAAREYALVGCIEPQIPGRQPAWGDSRFNAPLCLLAALTDFPEAGPGSFEELFERFSAQVRAALAEHAAGVNRVLATHAPAAFPDPFLSLLCPTCIDRARDINDGGVEFARFHGIAYMGLGTLADSLAALRKLLFEERAVSFARLRAALKADFAADEPLRQMLLNGAPKYGNADPCVDTLARRLVQAAVADCDRLSLGDGGHFLLCVAANIQNISAGREVGATPDGRHAGTPLSDAGSPYYGRDQHGPTAFIESVATPDYREVGCSVVNMRFDPAHFTGEAGVTRFTSFTRAFVARQIQELQFNCNDNALLAEALAHPEEHAGLVVRVSGFSAYFTQLDRSVQEDIMRRRAHGFGG